jgi:tRNA A-37 threonylcarbamoyl transferase component Bud32
MAASWYCKVFGEVMGPMSSQKLLEMAQSQKLQPKDLVRRNDSKWVPAHMVKGLFQSAQDTPTEKATATKTMAAAGPAPAAAKRPSVADDQVLNESATKQDSEEDSTTILRGMVPGAFLGNYMIMEKLGEGGMGVVLKARHRRMDRVVALKVLHLAATKSPATVKRFQQEAQAAARLSHPNLVAAYDADEANGAHFLVMEFVEGTPLSDLLDKQGPLPIRDAVNYIAQACRGLAYAHAEGIIHRDIKPSNLFLDKTGVIKIMDMGLARVDAPQAGPADATAAENLTAFGQLMGTFDYMAPEQAEDARKADHRSDIYSVGCTLFRLLTGRPPYYAETPVHKIIAHRDHAVPSLVEARKGCTKELNAVFNLMVAKKADDRYQSMNDLLTDLGMYLNGGTVRAGTLRKAQELIQRQPTKVGEKPPSAALPPGGAGPAYFCRMMGEEMGPFTVAQMAEMKQKKQLQPDDMVRHEDKDQWISAAEVPGLF